jgi:hypothetical protein
MMLEASPLCAEARLLLVCGAASADAAKKSERLREIIGSGLDWDYAIRSAQNHRVTPLLYRTLATAPSDLIPDDVLQGLRKRSLLNTMHNIALIKELCRVTEKLEGHGISAMPFKGPVLAQSAYGDISSRQFDDLDILVMPEKIAEVDELLASMGYQEEDQYGRDISKARQKAIRRYQYHHHFFNPLTKAHLEIHWTLSPRLYSFHQDTVNLWNRSNFVELENCKVRGLSAEDTLVIICDHAARHRWNRLSWILDVSMLLSKKSLDWGIVLQQAKEWKSKRALRLGLYLAKDLLDAPLPDDILKMVTQDQAVKDLASEAFDQLFPNGRADNDSPEDRVLQNIHTQLFYIKARDGSFDRARLHLGLATTPTKEDWNALPLPDQLFFLYHLVRPMRQACAYRTKILSWLFR